ncbi:MAG: hypothetical protein RLZZ245_2879 [Verrucomicrobiota bacterium]
MPLADNLNTRESIDSGSSYTSQIHLLNQNKYSHDGSFIISETQPGSI